MWFNAGETLGGRADGVNAKTRRPRGKSAKRELGSRFADLLSRRRVSRPG
ncbi:MAG: hypothetical protein AVDCRST_MAG64-2975 [uncultured Phycisphaerae bacterium]|uniref:Uncharacterized protein n=1 Tax=uncultured Phycisphaerae bacterium TaxID=904963 RepID=A0A6J4PY04_9BACT|nr:MAG: hypothetical protein AVDCRST_MAG64-2975 [uncultured Phycisphaerae bacterium]